MSGPCTVPGKCGLANFTATYSYFRFPITVLFPRKNCWSFIDFHLVLSGSSAAIVNFWNNLVDPYRSQLYSEYYLNVHYLYVLYWILEWEFSFFFILVTSIYNVNLFSILCFQKFHFQNSSIHLLNSFFNPNEIFKNLLVKNNLVLVAKVRN